MTFDNEGRFRPQQFEDFFSKYDIDKKGGLTKVEIWRGLRGQACAFDIFGFFASAFECTCPMDKTNRPCELIFIDRF